MYNPWAKSVSQSKTFSIQAHLIACVAIMAGLIFGVGGWAATATLSGAVVAAGSVVVERNVKKVQHNHGGIVAEIAVKNGDRVSAGDVVLRLDATQLRAELGVLEGQIIEATARAGRLRAERDRASAIEWPAEFRASSRVADAAALAELRLFTEGRKVKAGQKEQLRMKIQQVTEEVAGIAAQRMAKSKELDLVDKTLGDLRKLFAGKLTVASRLEPVERDAQRLAGDLGSLASQAARASAQINELQLQILSIDETETATAQRDLVATQSRLAELQERIAAVRDKLERVDIRAPWSGVVHELSVHTVGGVVTAAEQLMLIVPGDDKLTIQARIQPNERDQVKDGRSARVRLSAFNQQTTPEVTGAVTHIASDITVDPKTGAPYYAVRIELDDRSKAKIGRLTLVPGMPVEAFVTTDERTVLSYLLKPIMDQLNRVFIEA